jgi:hypothetical protein
MKPLFVAILVTMSFLPACSRQAEPEGLILRAPQDPEPLQSPRESVVLTSDPGDSAAKPGPEPAASPPAAKATSGENIPQVVVALKPTALLPSATINENIGLKARIEAFEDSKHLKLIAPDQSYKLDWTFGFGTQGCYSDGEPRLWSQGAIHEIAKTVAFAGYSFEPDTGSVLVFQVEPTKGYVHMSGQGKVTTPDGSTIILNDAKKGTVLGQPAPAANQARRVGQGS